MLRRQVCQRAGKIGMKLVAETQPA